MTEPDTTTSIAALADRAGVRRIQLLAWRDLDDPTAGGSEIHINAIAAVWAASGLDVVLRTGRVDGSAAELDRNGVTVIRRGGPLGTWVRQIAAAITQRDGPVDARVEVWHGVSFFSPLWSRVPTVGIFHHVHTDQFGAVLPPGLAQLARFLERRVYPRLYRGRRLIALSESVRDQMIAELHWPADDLVVVEPGVDARFVPGTRSPTPLVLTVGRLMPQKHVDDVIRVLAAAKQRVPELRAVIVGDGPERPALERLAASLDASSWIDFAGHIDDTELLTHYQGAWALLSASRKEGWGMTITEAAACATPSVVTDIPGHRQAVDPARSGILASSPEELTGALVDVLSDTDLRERLAAGARRHAARYRWERAARDVLASLVGP